MGITSSNKVIDKTTIGCDGILQVTLALTAAPDIITNPTDIVLVLDRSGSMTGQPLEAMKEGALAFIDIIRQATDGGSDQIGSGSRMGVVSFSTTAQVNTPLTTSVPQLNQAVEGLTAGGSTNHGQAFALATQLLNNGLGNAKVMVMFTDGKTTAGPPPAPIAEAAKALGIIVYCIGLIGSDGLDVDAINQWATDPDATHVVITPNVEDLEELFAELAANLTKPGATGIVIDEKVNPDFAILNVSTPSKGQVVQLSDTQLKWTIDQLGIQGSESAILNFTVKHRGSTGGVKSVNAAVEYRDDQGNLVSFPDPKVNVDCPVVVIPEPCPDPVEVSLEGCADRVVVDGGEVSLLSQGRLLFFDVTLKQVCPDRRVALAVALTQQNDRGEEISRGMKVFSIPAHQGPGCRDVEVRCLPFVLPEDEGLCPTRELLARFFANYLDTDFRCCEE